MSSGQRKALPFGTLVVLSGEGGTAEKMGRVLGWKKDPPTEPPKSERLKRTCVRFLLG